LIYISKLDSLRAACLECKACSLSATRTNLVFGDGNENTELMFVGEGPGEQEDLSGQPFVGRAGKLLDDMLSMIGLDRTMIYIANTVKCRPPGNRDPKQEEQEAVITA
jgi:DNA polymerase